MVKIFYGTCFLWCLYIIQATYPEIIKYSNLIAVRWCEPSNIPSSQNRRQGTYRYMEDMGNEQYAIKDQSYSYRVEDIWQPYRIDITTRAENIPSHENADKWLDIPCD